MIMREYNSALTVEDARKVFWYDPSTGVLTRNGEEVGSIVGKGYLRVVCRSRPYQCHRLIWLWWYGRWPEHQIDHINGIKIDNRIKNLRDVTLRENQMNMKISSANKSGVTGVSWCKMTKKWVATIGVESETIHLGGFDDIASAAKVRKQAEIEYSFHPNHGRQQRGNYRG